MTSLIGILNFPKNLRFAIIAEILLIFCKNILFYLLPTFALFTKKENKTGQNLSLIHFMYNTAIYKFRPLRRKCILSAYLYEKI